MCTIVLKVVLGQQHCTYAYWGEYSWYYGIYIYLPIGKVDQRKPCYLKQRE